MTSVQTDTTRMTQNDLPADLGPLRSQDTLEPLTVDGPDAVTAAGGSRYAVRNGLVFMGYAARDEAMIRETMEEERDWQGTPAHVGRDEQFLRHSAPRAAEFISIIKRLTGGRQGLAAAELGAGSGWVSWMMANAGFDMWICDFEPNSLFSGWVYAHDRLGPGRRIVADARYAPFADQSFDVVLLKEFVHHVEERDLLLAEANRILRPGGIVAVMDPARSAWKRLYELRHPDDHKGHHIVSVDAYLKALRANGFRRRWLTHTYPEVPRKAITRTLQARASRSVEGLRHNRSVYTALHARLLGTGGYVYLGEKVREAERVPRPEFRPIDPDSLRLDWSDISAWEGCRRIVEQAAATLR